MNETYIQTLIFWHVVEDIALVNRFECHYFEKEGFQIMFRLMKPYILKYQVVPDENVFMHLVRTNGRYPDKMTPDIVHSVYEQRTDLARYSREWLHDIALGLAEWQNFIIGVRELNSYIMTTQSNLTPETAHQYVENVKNHFDENVRFTLNDSPSHDFFNLEEHKSSKTDHIPTGYRFIDMCLNGGWVTKTLNVLMGSPKVGKSQWLCNLAANSIKQGMNSVYITLEMDYSTVFQRIGANLWNIPIYEYEKRVDDTEFMQTKMDSFIESSIIAPGTLIVRDYPTSSATVSEIESMLRQEEKDRSISDQPFKFKNIFIDYINIMADGRGSRNNDNTYLKIKNICEDLRAMAQRNDWCVISLTQTNRQGMNSEEVDMTNVAESAGLVATVDSLFAIICTPMMMAEGSYYLRALALRNSPHMGDSKRFDFSKDYLRITESTDDIIPQGKPIKLCQIPNDRQRKADEFAQTILKKAAVSSRNTVC